MHSARIVLGRDCYFSFRAKSGWMLVCAEVAVSPDGTLLFSNVDYKPLHTKHLNVGVGETIRFLKELESEAYSQGYTKLVI